MSDAISSRYSLDIKPVQPVSGMSRAAPLPSLAIGENLDVFVLRHEGERRALLQVKNTPLMADTSLPLPSGITLKVRVDQLRPNLVLRIISPENTGYLTVQEFLKTYRSHPDAMKDLIVTAGNFLNEDSLRQLSDFLPIEDLQALHQLIQHLGISSDQLEDPLFLKNIFLTLGLASERKLLKALSNPDILKDIPGNPTLKDILLKLAADIQALPNGNEEGSLKHPRQLKPFSDFIDHALHVIESLQMVNVLAQEQDGLLTLPIPFQLPDGIRMQHAFIETDRKANPDKPGRLSRIVLFLDMDALGEMAIDAVIRDGIFHCTVKCQDRQGCVFIETLIPELCEALAGCGYQVGGVQCVPVQDLRSWELGFLNGHNIFKQNTVNIHV